MRAGAGLGSAKPIACDARRPTWTRPLRAGHRTRGRQLHAAHRQSVTAAGMPAAGAANLVRRMAGRCRLPGALRRADTPRADRSARHHDRPPARLTYADARNAAEARACSAIRSGALQRSSLAIPVPGGAGSGRFAGLSDFFTGPLRGPFERHVPIPGGSPGLGPGLMRTPMGKANHLKPIHTEGTTSITTRRESAENKTATRAGDSRRTGILMAANLELTGRTPVFFRGR